MDSKKNGKKVDIYTMSTPKSLPSQKDNHVKFWNIDKEMLRFKVHYFLFVGAFGASLPYITIFAQTRVGISASSLAAILTTQLCIFIISKPSIGYVSDYFNKLKVIICVLSVVSTVVLFLLLAVPKIKKDTEETTLGSVATIGNACDVLYNFDGNYSSEFRENNRYKLPSILHLNNSSKNNDSCFPSLANVSNFLRECSRSNMSGINKTGNILEDIVDLDQKFNATSSKPDSFVCEACCKLSGECLTIECRIPENSIKKVLIERKHINDFQTYQFWLYAFLTTISMTCINSFFTLTDTACCDSVQKSGAQFGRQRLWGACGWGLLSPVSGLLIDYTGDFLASWIVMAFMSLMSLLNMTRLQIGKPQFSKNLLKDVGTVLASKEFLAFKLCVLMNGVGTGIMWFYLVWFLTEIGGSRFLCGLVMFVQCFVGEIPFMFFSEWVIKKIGHFNVLALSMMAYCIRFFWYSRLHNPWLVLPAEVLHGFTYGLFYPNVASFATLSAKPGTEATTQAVLFTAHEGIGVGIGCVAAGIGFDTIGGHTTFLYTSIFSGVAVILSIMLNLFVRKLKGSVNVTPSTS